MTSTASSARTSPVAWKGTSGAVRRGTMSDDKAVRRVVLVEVDSTRRWSSSALTEYLNERVPDLRPVVFGSMASGEVDAAYRKLRQLSREVEQGRPTGDLVHSAHKALSFFRDMLPDRLWSWWMVGESHGDRKRLGATSHGGPR